MAGVTETIDRALHAAGLVPHPQTQAPPAEVTRPQQDRFAKHSFANASGARDYKLYVPASRSGGTAEPAPLLVMLHGCKQSPDDFAAGTRMNELAEEHGFLVLYPAQAANANGSRCWNWFRPGDQGRDLGEPSIIADLTREVASANGVDMRRIFVAGMSAGAAMALILGDRYPELYAAVGAHSAPCYWAAHDVPSAFSAMRGGGTRSPFSSSTRAIVFHGDRDPVVNVGNADAIVEHVMGFPGSAFHASERAGEAVGGRAYRRKEYLDAASNTAVEHWVVHGAGHAWSGGSASGSYTDPHGPDASAEMVRFFLSQPRAGSS
jgi:poly(hydroxyalkanoate) depolymerase family esterase